MSALNVSPAFGPVPAIWVSSSTIGPDGLAWVRRVLGRLGRVVRHRPAG
jgi:hypothetical protein